MKYIILCGGIGKRCNQYSLLKPFPSLNSCSKINLNYNIYLYKICL